MVTSSIEHPAVTEVVQYLVDSEGFRSTVVGVNEEGLVDVDEVMAAIEDGTTVVSLSESSQCLFRFTQSMQVPCVP